MVIVGLISLVALGPGLAQASKPIPAECGDNLATPHGRYVLTHDLACPESGGPIVISADAVKLDLAGHTITNVPPCPRCTPSGLGIWVGGQVPFSECKPTKGVEIENGTLTGGYGETIRLDCAQHAKIRHMLLTQNRGTDGDGIHLHRSSLNYIRDNTITDNGRFGIWLTESHHNRIVNNEIRHQYGAYPDSANLYVLGSDDNLITRNVLSHTEVGLWLSQASRNKISSNTVNHNAVNIVLLGDSDGNVLHANEANGANRDGINIGCRDFCPMGAHFETEPTTGTDDNVIKGNTANNNARYGIAQAPGNLRNRFRKNAAAGNRVADFAIEP